ncbi:MULTISPECIES: hypothetical protein [unclassified Haloarcula]|uniref:DUF7557 family protein n=1 Tax=unclassified Haloarcula TaxID=2624677 RepID=UPI001784C25B|nr:MULTISPECIES: hypothetical protein [unclassified Haloarcula]
MCSSERFGYASRGTGRRTSRPFRDLHVEDESSDDVVTALINIDEAEELTLFHDGDEY